MCLAMVRISRPASPMSRAILSRPMGIFAATSTRPAMPATVPIISAIRSDRAFI